MKHPLTFLGQHTFTMSVIIFRYNKNSQSLQFSASKACFSRMANSNGFNYNTNHKI